VLDNLDSYEGRSLFTTWAQKIAVRVALTELRRKRWQDVSLDAAPRSQSDPPSSGYAGPETRVDRKEAVAFVRRMMAEELTEKQQTAMRAVAFSGLPLTEVARRMGTNRNALYKLLHDARKRLKNRLSREGVTIEELLDTVDRE
jgi:RNA polymerase sigma-70 factor (ECF subfamily)